MLKKMILFAAVILLAAVFPEISTAKLIYQETVTIVLQDGTQVNLVLDDHGMPEPKASGPMRRVDLARAEFKSKVAKQEKEFKERNTPWWARLKSDEEKKKRKDYLDRKRDHGNKKYLWPGSAEIPEKRYYYLPPPPRVARDTNGKPQFLFIKFVTDKAEDQDGVSGGVLHFLAEYGLSPEQEKELEEKLKERIEGSKLMGAVSMELGSDETSFKIISATLTDKGFTKSIITSGKAPIMPGMKVAAAARLDQYGATLLAETLKKTTSDISIEFDLAYTSFLPAFEGTVNINWEKFKSHVDDYQLKYSHTTSGGSTWYKPWTWGRSKKNYYTKDEMHTVYDMMCSEKVIDIQWTERIVDERVNMIRETFMKIFTSMFFDKEQEKFMGDDDDGGGEGKVSESDKVTGESYKVYKFYAKSEEVYENVTYHLRTNLPIKTPYQVVGNINGEWYRRTKEEYPDCFGEINIDDPFFQRRKVLLTLDLDAVEIFDKVINYATVEVRKRRSSGRDFTDSFTFNKQVVTSTGVTAAINYAKMREDDPGVYQYKIQWSLRGGNLFPGNPRWETGSWEGVTLAPPVKPLNIDVEADLEEFKNNDIAAVTVKLRYRKFGRLYEDPKTMRLSASGDKPQTGCMIFHDKDNARYDYKITYHHKKKGPVDMGWVSGRTDAYIYCYLPEKLQKKEKSDLF